MSLVEDACNMVWMNNGSCKLPSWVQVGDELVGWDEKHNHKATTKVVQVFTPIHKHYYVMSFEGGHKCMVSVGQPFFVLGVGWVTAAEMIRGHIPRRELGNTYSLFSLRRKRKVDREERTYSWVCAPHDNFFVGRETGFLLHNGSCG